MSSFLSGLGRALRAPGLGDRLQAALAAAGGDTGSIQRLRALQLQQAELQRQNDARDAQVIGAKNLGFSNDEIGALSPQDLSWAARRRIAPAMVDPGGGPPGGGEGGDIGQASPINASPEPLAPDSIELPGKMRGAFDPKRVNGLVEHPIPYKRALELFGPGVLPGFGGALGGAAATLRRANTPGHAAALPKGTPFIAPDGSIRRKI
jgi:hypothetical protein